MTPNEKGRFCSLCAKSVVDFTAMPRSEVESYLIENSGTKICGRFNNSQIDNAPVTLHIPAEVLYKRQHSFRNMFMLALVVCMGSVLFSCKGHDGKPVDIMGDTVYAPQDIITDIKTQKPTDPAKCTTKAGDSLTEETTKLTLKGVTVGMVAPEPPDPFFLGEPAVDPVAQRVEKDVYNLAEAEIQPEFPGGISKLYEYIYSGLKVPESPEAINRKMVVSFIVEKDGSLSDIKVLRGVAENLDAQVISRLKDSPKWTPAKIGSQAIRVSFLLPIAIKGQE
jgi:Gram-negative bacterial TonB protein C-terminal